MTITDIGILRACSERPIAVVTSGRPGVERYDYRTLDAAGLLADLEQRGLLTAASQRLYSEPYLECGTAIVYRVTAEGESAVRKNSVFSAPNAGRKPA